MGFDARSGELSDCDSHNSSPGKLPGSKEAFNAISTFIRTSIVPTLVQFLCNCGILSVRPKSQRIFGIDNPEPIPSNAADCLQHFAAEI
jgi:hypothetical protein